MDTPISFAGTASFRQELRKRIDQYFTVHSLSKRDNLSLYIKAGIMLGWTGLSYYALVFQAHNFIQAATAGLSLALALAGVGFNIQHDANHGGFSRRPWLNRVAGSTLDYLIGASSFVWKQKHNGLHHVYTNLPDNDDDINVWFLGRLSPEQKRYWFHRYQQWYLWGLYGLLHLMYLYSDFQRLVSGAIDGKQIRRPRGWNLAVFIVGKVVFLSFAFVVPGLLHPLWQVALGYVAVSFVIGAMFSIVFQLAHMIKETDHPHAVTQVSTEWAIHQLHTTANFAPHSWLLTWYLGGLNHQVEHHLFTDISHVHYPALAGIVEEAAREYGLPYNVHQSFGKALQSHFLFLRLMGRP